MNLGHVTFSYSQGELVMKNLSALKIGSRYTLVKMGDMGFPFAAHLELVDRKITPYAQYAETVLLTFKLKGKRNLRELRIFERDDYLIYEGWVAVNTEMYVETLPPSPGGLTCKRSLTSFDVEYLLRAKRSVAQAPLIEKISEESLKRWDRQL